MDEVRTLSVDCWVRGLRGFMGVMERAYRSRGRGPDGEGGDFDIVERRDVVRN